MKIIRMLKLADYVTMGNFISGLLAIMFSLRAEFTIAALLIIAGVLFDFFDGRVARWTKQENELGKQLDSLSDVLTFGVAVAIFGFTQGLNSTLSIIVITFFALCGMLRLARFNVTKTKGFIGMPITANGLVFPVAYFIFGTFNEYMLIPYLVMALLMISDIRIKKI